jgi:hypothetical protein
VFLRTLVEVAVENEQRDVEGGVSELHLHDSWMGHPHTLLLPCALSVHCTPEFAGAKCSILVT